MSFRWRKNPKQTGLASVCAGARGSTLYKDKTIRYATVSELKQTKKWYWVAGWGSGLIYKNTCDNPVNTEQEAKNNAMSYCKNPENRGDHEF